MASRTEVIPTLADPECAEMTWSPFAKWFQKKYSKPIVSFECYHTGTTTSIGMSTIRTTREGHLVLVMEIKSSNDVYVVLSKAQGCDDIKVGDPNFIGWLRRYEGPGSALNFDRIDSDVDSFYQQEIGFDEDIDQGEPLSVDAFKVLHGWRELMMRPRKNDKGQWSYVYVTQVDGGTDYTLLNKGAKFLRTGQLAKWNPPKAKWVGPDEREDVKWMWYEADAVHYFDENDDEFSIGFGELVCFRHTGREIEAEQFWMGNDGIMNPFTRRYLPTGFVEHIAGRKRLALPVDGFKCCYEYDNDDCSDINEEGTEPGSLVTISWRQSSWNCKVVLDPSRITNVHVECESDDRRASREPHTAGAGINYGDNRPWLWFFVQKTADRRKMWWKCPKQIVDVMETQKRRRNPRGLVREADRAPPAAYYEQPSTPLVREVEDQLIPCDGVDTPNAKPKKGVKCWICNDRWLNDHKQLVDHIEGAGEGSKSHLKYRRRWMEEGQPQRADWLQFLKEENKEKTDDNAPSTADPPIFYQ